MSEALGADEYSWTATVGGRRARVTMNDDESFTVTCRRETVQLDLSQVPPETVLVLAEPRAGSTRELTLSGAGRAHTLRVTHPTSVTIVDGQLGRLECDPGERRGETVLAGNIDDLLVGSGSPVLQPDAQVHRVRVYGGELQVGEATVGTLELHGGKAKGALDRIERVELHASGQLPNGCAELFVAVGRITLEAGSPRTVGRLHLPHGGGPMTLSGQRRSGQSRVEVEVISGRGTLVLDHVDLTVAQVDGHARIEGQGTLIVQRGPAVTDVELGPQIRVNARPGSALRRCTGDLVVVSARDATIAADPNGALVFNGVVRDNYRRSEPLEGAMLRGISLNDDARGRQRLQDLQHAAVIEPELDKLRVKSLRWRIPGAARRLQHGDEASAREVDDAAFFAEELAALVHRKAGSGAIRTKTSWAAYRGRHLTSQSQGERLLLGLYRLVGYGQRPGPAALLWLTLSASMALAAGAVGWLDETALAAAEDPALLELFGVLVLSPLFLLRLAGDPELGEISGFADVAVVLARTVIAAPFLFTAIAVSRLLRADWRFT